MKKSVCSWRLDLDYVLPPESISDDTVSLCVCVCVGGGGGGVKWFGFWALDPWVMSSSPTTRR